MRSTLERFAWETWRGEGGVSGALARTVARPTAVLYGGWVRARNRRYDRSGGVPVPGATVISVGNLAVGGTGKTPVAAWVARRMVEAGASAAVVSRGYGGDEEGLHRGWNPGIPVFIGADRVAGARAAVREGARAIVLDDGFQHRRLHRDVDVVLLAAEDGLPGRLLPAGPFREGRDALARADAVVVTHRHDGSEPAQALTAAVRPLAPEAVVACAQLASCGWRSLDGAPSEAPSAPVLVAAAVSRPEAVRAAVESETGHPADLLAFADHHPYDRADFDRITREAAGRPIVVTEKDAVKLRSLPNPSADVRVLLQEVRWNDGLPELESLLLRALERIGR